MPVHSFSTKSKRPTDEATVQAVRLHCDQRNLNFSGVVIRLLKRYEEEVVNVKV